MEETLRQLRLRLEALHQIELKISAEVDLETLLQAVVSYSIELTGGCAGAFFICRPERGILELVTALGLEPNPTGLHLRKGEGLAGKIWETGRALIVNDYLNWEGHYPLAEGTPYAAAVGTPVYWKQDLVGVLVVLGQLPCSFSPVDRDSLEMFAPLAATAIRNAQLYDELQARMRELKETQERLFQMAHMASLGVLAGGIAHQVRNPLAIISTSAQLLADHLEDEALRQRCIDRICTATERISHIIGNLLGFAHPVTGPMATVDLNTILDETLGLLGYELAKREIALVREIEPDLPPVHGNAMGLQRVFLNLIVNAVNAMPQGGTLTVAAHTKPAEQVEIQFRDDGVGIPAENLTRIFEPFFTTMPVGKGIGLGLSLSYSIVQQHGGTLEVESQEGQGSTFTVRLPRLAEGGQVQNGGR